jgi:hypothetical protein
MLGNLWWDGYPGVHTCYREILLPDFVLGCILAPPPGSAPPHRHDAFEGHQEGPETSSEQRVATLISAAFMVLVGLESATAGS